jgi:hypothetical protein
VSVLWAAVFLGLAFALWRRQPITRLIVPLASLVYGLNRIVWPGPCPVADRSAEALPLEGVIFIAAVLVAALVLNLASGRTYFGSAGKQAVRGRREKT